MGWGCRRRKDPDTTQGWCPENPGWGSGLPTTAPPVPGVGLLLQRAAWGGGKAAVQSLCCHSSCGGTSGWGRPACRPGRPPPASVVTDPSHVCRSFPELTVQCLVTVNSSLP